MKVKIVSSKLCTFWYAGKIGEVFEVEQKDEYDYHVIGEDKSIGIEDCKIIEETMGKREELIKETEEFLEFVKDEKTVRVFPHNYFKEEIKFDDEQPKIMSVDEIFDEYFEKTTSTKGSIQRAWDESAKRFQQLVDELKSKTLKEDDPELFDIYIRLLNLVIE